VNRALLAHCDWSKDPRKRWMAVAVRDGDFWRTMLPEPVGDTADLFARLARRAGGGVLVGFDFPIGLPLAYGERTCLGDFPNALRRFGQGEWRDWYEVCETAEQISLFRPFYPTTPGGRSANELFDGLGLSGGELLRVCERATPERQAACKLFWTLGPNQVGKGAISGWRDVIAPNLDQLGLWPFAGSLAALDRASEIIVTETYPGEAYGHLGISRREMGSKSKQEGRRRAAPALLDWMATRRVDGSAVREAIEAGFSSRRVSEDQFDAVVGLFGMLDVMEGRRPEGTPKTPAIATWEGWILGQERAIG
jgi:hypothetical protein